MSYLPANDDFFDPLASTGKSEKVLEWLARLAQPGVAVNLLTQNIPPQGKAALAQMSGYEQQDDWQIICNLSGHSLNDFMDAGATLPLTAAEVDHFRRNHRCVESHISRDFLAARTDLPSPLAELYSLYLHRARVDVEAALFVAQATGSIRVGRAMADLLAVGGFANGLEYIPYVSQTYSVPAAFDTSDMIDRANQEALRRLTLDADNPSHLLQLSPDEIGVLAIHMVEQHAMAATTFLDKANRLAEARQDVTRLPVNTQFATALQEGDLPTTDPWVMRLCVAYARLLPTWVADLPEIAAAFGN
ncbi:MAG: hypothetical protein JO126_08960 [Alphaproteobacteria bacterium]|nr:hypothetical protein [Alphaproteobacteria bacterium]MBV8549570.1 hypothetical protein [Alphaproteobacteria bacterium]